MLQLTDEYGNIVNMRHTGTIQLRNSSGVVIATLDSDALFISGNDILAANGHPRIPRTYEMDEEKEPDDIFNPEHWYINPAFSRSVTMKLLIVTWIRVGQTILGEME